MGQRWSRKHAECTKCHKTTLPHTGHGLCRHCYDRVRKGGGRPRDRHGPNYHRARRLYVQGLNICEIAAVIGRTRQRVHRIVADLSHQRLDVPRKCRNCGATFLSKHRKHMCPNCTMKPSCPRCGRPMSFNRASCRKCFAATHYPMQDPRNVAKAVRLYRSGLNYRAVGQRLGASAMAVWHALRGKVISRPSGTRSKLNE